MAENRRIFIGFIIPEADKEELFNLARDLIPLAEGIKLTKKENLHLTIAFLGSISIEKVATLESILKDSKSIIRKPVEIVVKTFAPFPKQNSKLFAALVEKNSDLEKIWALIWNQLKQLGFLPDHQVFRPHITLARKCVIGKQFNIEKRIQLKEIAIFESRSSEAGVEYIPLKKFIIAL